MKKILTLVFVFFLLNANAQQSCCSVTSDFADLGKDAQFLMEHQLPALSSKVDASGKWIEFPTASGKNGRAYLNNSINPGEDYLFIFHEWWGLNDNIVAEADKWAGLLDGVNVLAIDLYDGKSASTREGASELMQAAEEDRIREIISGAMAYAGSDATFATIGWCFGGGWSMQASIMLGDRSAACVVYYGMPEQSVEKLEQLQAPVLGIFAEKDQWINHSVVGEYESAMSKADKSFETLWFDAEHAFANPSNPVFNEKASTEANSAALNFIYKALIR
jgi:carboxymethylenebutenolidase